MRFSTIDDEVSWYYRKTRDEATSQSQRARLVRSVARTKLKVCIAGNHVRIILQGQEEMINAKS